MLAEYVPLLGFERDYEIQNTYPFNVKCKRNEKIIADTFNNSNGYIQVKLNGKTYLKHRLIAEKFIPNPDNLTDVDHVDHNRTNYHLENLRWVTRSDNSRNRSSFRTNDYEYVDEINDDAMVVSRYGKHELENYYFHNDIFYFYNGINYRKLRVLENKTGVKYVYVTPKNHKSIPILYTKFKRENGLF